MNKNLCIVLGLAAIASMGYLAGPVEAAELPRGVERFHDDEFGVTCWKYHQAGAAGISCIPDSQIGPSNSPHEEDEIEPQSASLPIKDRREEWLRL